MLHSGAIPFVDFDDLKIVYHISIIFNMPVRQVWRVLIAGEVKRVTPHRSRSLSSENVPQFLSLFGFSRLSSLWSPLLVIVYSFDNREFRCSAIVNVRHRTKSVQTTNNCWNTSNTILYTRQWNFLLWYSSWLARWQIRLSLLMRFGVARGQSIEANGLVKKKISEWYENIFTSFILKKYIEAKKKHTIFLNIWNTQFGKEKARCFLISSCYCSMSPKPAIMELVEDYVCVYVFIFIVWNESITYTVHFFSHGSVRFSGTRVQYCQKRNKMTTPILLIAYNGEESNILAKFITKYPRVSSHSVTFTVPVTRVSGKITQASVTNLWSAIQLPMGEFRDGNGDSFSYGRCEIWTRNTLSLMAINMIFPENVHSIFPVDLFVRVSIKMFLWRLNKRNLQYFVSISDTVTPIPMQPRSPLLCLPRACILRVILKRSDSYISHRSSNTVLYLDLRHCVIKASGQATGMHQNMA